MLSNIKEEVGVIAVAGKYRTGKSFLLNRILLGKKENLGFGVGPTVNACTKGLWIWNRPVEVTKADGKKMKVLVIDSEGIGAFTEDSNHDNRIFLLALLISSYFIYNSMGSIDESALSNLSLIISLSMEIQVKSGQQGSADPDKIAEYFPSFLWVVRDFALKIEDEVGNKLSSKGYLEKSLKELAGTSDKVEEKNKIRRKIVSMFQDRDCFTLVRPTEEEKNLQKL